MSGICSVPLPELEGCEFDTPNPSVTTIRCMIAVIVADLPARAKLGGWKDGGLSGCYKCKVVGVKGLAMLRGGNSSSDGNGDDGGTGAEDVAGGGAGAAVIGGAVGSDDDESEVGSSSEDGSDDDESVVGSVDEEEGSEGGSDDNEEDDETRSSDEEYVEYINEVGSNEGSDGENDDAASGGVDGAATASGGVDGAATASGLNADEAAAEERGTTGGDNSRRDDSPPAYYYTGFHRQHFHPFESKTRQHAVDALREAAAAPTKTLKENILRTAGVRTLSGMDQLYDVSATMWLCVRDCVDMCMSVCE